MDHLEKPNIIGVREIRRCDTIGRRENDIPTLKRVITKLLVSVFIEGLHQFTKLTHWSETLITKFRLTTERLIIIVLCNVHT